MNKISNPHPYLRDGGSPLIFIPKHGSSAPELDPLNFSLDGKLGQLLCSTAFHRFLTPMLESSETYGRTTEEIWSWSADRLGLKRWRNPESVDLQWFESVLDEIDFLNSKRTANGRRWFHEDWS